MKLYKAMLAYYNLQNIKMPLKRMVHKKKKSFSSVERKNIFWTMLVTKQLMIAIDFHSLKIF